MKSCDYGLRVLFDRKKSGVKNSRVDIARLGKMIVRGTSLEGSGLNDTE